MGFVYFTELIDVANVIYPARGRLYEALSTAIDDYGSTNKNEKECEV